MPFGQNDHKSFELSGRLKNSVRVSLPDKLLTGKLGTDNWDIKQVETNVQNLQNIVLNLSISQSISRS